MIGNTDKSRTNLKEFKCKLQLDCFSRSQLFWEAWRIAYRMTCKIANNCYCNPTNSFQSDCQRNKKSLGISLQSPKFKPLYRIISITNDLIRFMLFYEDIHFNPFRIFLKIIIEVITCMVKFVHSFFHLWYLFRNFDISKLDIIQLMKLFRIFVWPVLILQILEYLISCPEFEILAMVSYGPAQLCGLGKMINIIEKF